MKTESDPNEPSPSAGSAALARLAESWRAMATALFEKDGLTTFFQHARNVLTGAAVVGAGLYAINHVGATHLHGMWAIHVAGYAIAALGGLLLALNLFDGLRRLAKLEHPRFLKIGAILFYVALSVRLTQVIIYFRSPI